MTSPLPDDGDMDQVSKKYASDEAFREVANLLFGDGATELIAKANPDSADLSLGERKRRKRQAQIGLATNVIGIAAGTAALGESAHKYKQARGSGKVQPFKDLSRAGKLKRLSIPAAGLAGAGLALQGANVGGDIIANRVLSREAKKKVHKMAGQNGCLVPPSGSTKGKLVRVAGNKVEPKLKGQLKKLKEQTLAKSAETPVEISKVNEDKKQVFGWASVVEKNGQPIVDLQGDYIPVEEMEKASYAYVRKSRKAGDMHLREGDQARVVGEMIESFAVTPEKKQALGLPDEIPIGWWVGFQIEDDQVWADIKSGKRTGFSVHGTGIRSPHA